MSVDTAPTVALRGEVVARRRVFGIHVEATVDLPGLDARPRDVRRVSLSTASARAVGGAWNAGSATRVLERRRRDDSLVMSVDHAAGVGYRIHAPRVGLHLVSPDGLTISSALPRIAPWRWQRLLFAQVLPLAATLQGLELLHASAVEWKGRMVALVARSGTGKTSTAAHMVAAGASPVTDDVLALEEVGGEVVGHPGAPTFSVDRAQLERMEPDGRRRVGRLLGEADKLVLEVELPTRPRRLDMLFALERHATGGIAIERVSPDPLLALAHSFNTYVRSPERVLNQLAIAGRLTETVPMYAVRFSPGSDARSVACAVARVAEGGQ